MELPPFPEYSISVYRHYSRKPRELQEKSASEEKIFKSPSYFSKNFVFYGRM